MNKFIICAVVPVFAICAFWLVCVYGQPKMKIDAEKESGLAEILTLTAEFEKSADTNVLARLAGLVESPKLGAKAAAAMRTLKPKLSGMNVEEIVIPALVKGLDHPSLFVKRESAISILEFSNFAKPAIPALRRMLNAGGDASRFAIQALGRIGSPAKEALPELIRILEKPDHQGEVAGGFEDITIRVYAAEAITRIGLQDTATRKKVEQLLGDKNRYVRARSAQALIESGFVSQASNGALVDLMRSGDEDMRLFVLKILKELRTIPEQVMAELRNMVSDSDSEVQAAARAILDRNAK